MKRLMYLFISLLLVVGLGTMAFAAEKPVSKGIIVNPNPPKFSASIWTDRSEYKIGDPVKISFRSDVDGYAVLYDYTSDGRSSVIWPQKGNDGWVSAGHVYTLPDGNYTFNASEPTGPENLVLVVSRSRASLTLEFNTSRPLVQGLTAKLQTVPNDTWVSASCSFNVIPRIQKPTLRINGGSGATIYIDGQNYGTAPLTAQLEAGRHQLVAILPGMFVQVKEVRVRQNQGGFIDWWLSFKPVR